MCGHGEEDLPHVQVHLLRIPEEQAATQPGYHTKDSRPNEGVREPGWAGLRNRPREAAVRGVLALCVWHLSVLVALPRFLHNPPSLFYVPDDVDDPLHAEVEDFALLGRAHLSATQPIAQKSRGDRVDQRALHHEAAARQKYTYIQGKGRGVRG